MWFDSFIRNANVEIINPLQKKKNNKKNKTGLKKKENQKKKEKHLPEDFIILYEICFGFFGKPKKKLINSEKENKKKRNHPSLSPKKRRRTENGSRAIKAAKLSLVCSSFS